MYLRTGKLLEMTWFLPLLAEPAAQEPKSDTSILPTSIVSVQDGPPLHGFSDSSDSITSHVSSDQVKQRLQEVMAKLQPKLEARIGQDPEGYSKALASFEKAVDRLPSTVDSALQKSLYGFGKSETQVGIFYI